MTSNPLECEETSMPKFKIPLQKELLQVGEVLVLLTCDTSCHIQGLCSAVYALLRMKYGKVICMLIDNGDKYLFINIENRLIPGHSEGVFRILKYFDIYKMTLRDQ